MAMLLPSAMPCDSARPLPLPRYRLFSPPPSEPSSPMASNMSMGNGLLGTCRALQSLLSAASPSPAHSPVASSSFHVPKTRSGEAQQQHARRLQSPAPIDIAPFTLQLKPRKTRLCSAVTTAPIEKKRIVSRRQEKQVQVQVQVQTQSKPTSAAPRSPKRVISHKRSRSDFANDFDMESDAEKTIPVKYNDCRTPRSPRTTRFFHDDQENAPLPNQFQTPKRQRCAPPPVMPMGLSRSDFESLGFESPSGFTKRSVAEVRSPVVDITTTATNTTTKTKKATSAEESPAKKKKPAPLNTAFTTPLPIDETPSTSTPSFPFNIQFPFFSTTTTKTTTTNATAQLPKTPNHPFQTPSHPFSHHHTPPSSVSPPRATSRLPNISIPIPSFLASLASTITPITSTQQAASNEPTLPNWTPQNDSTLVNLIISKLALSPSQLRECATVLGKEPSQIEERWSGLVDRGVVGVLPGRYSPPKRARAREDVDGEGAEYFGRGEESLGADLDADLDFDRDDEVRFRERRFRRGNGRAKGGREGIWDEWKM